MPVAEVKDLNLVLLSQGVDLSRWSHSLRPLLVGTEVHMFPTVHSHEDDVILFIVFCVRVFPLLVSQLILARFSVKDIIEVIVLFETGRVQLKENRQLLLVVKIVIDLFLCLKIDNSGFSKDLIFRVP